MRSPSDWPKVMRHTYALVVPSYWACGVLGYLAYGDYSLANINLNFPRNAPNAISIAVQIVQEVYFVLTSNLVMLLHIELSLGIDPSVACMPRWRGIAPALARLIFRTLFFSSQAPPPPYTPSHPAVRVSTCPRVPLAAATHSPS